MAASSQIQFRHSHRALSATISKKFHNKSFSCLRNQPFTYHGLRSFNRIDMVHTMACVKTHNRRSGERIFSRRNVGHGSTIVCGKGMRIVFVGAEVTPWSKTGGLGDVLGGLPPAMAANGHRVMTAAPRYDQYRDAWDTSVVVEIKVGDEVHNVRFFHCYKRGVDRVFVDHPMFLEKVWGQTGSKLYGPTPGEDYDDNTKRFSLLCQAALEAPRVLNLNSSDYYSGPYGEDVVFVCNDWHTSLLPMFLKSKYKINGTYRNAKTVLCIHNISYQGRFPFSEFSSLGLPESFKSSFDFVESYNGGVRKINWLKAGILEADSVLTVSPYYAEELLTCEFKGMELENIVRATGITGILNGMDAFEWNPSLDKYIPVKYDATTVFDAKPINKEALQAEVGLPVDRNVPLVIFIVRLEEQKGVDILAAALPDFMGENIQLVALGTGKKKLEKEIEKLEEDYPNKARGVAKYGVALSHMMFAGADFILVPSRFEPAGLIQMQAMQYGTVPIVASTGGLVDTVKEGFTGFHIGGFNVDGSKVDRRDAMALSSTVKRAIGVYKSTVFTQMVQNCMAQDFSWKGPAKNWEKFLLGLDVYGSEEGIYGEEIAPLSRENEAVP